MPLKTPVPKETGQWAKEAAGERDTLAEICRGAHLHRNTTGSGAQYSLTGRGDERFPSNRGSHKLELRHSDIIGQSKKKSSPDGGRFCSGGESGSDSKRLGVAGTGPSSMCSGGWGVPGIGFYDSHFPPFCQNVLLDARSLGRLGG